MWFWTLNWGDIRDNIVIGSCPLTPADLDGIHHYTGATALLSLQTDACREVFAIDYAEHQRHAQRRRLTLVNTPMRDFDPLAQRQGLPAAVRALARLFADGHKVYVHCTAGINRAPLTVLGYLTFVEGMATDDAMALIRHGRPEAEPYWEAYHGCRQDLLEPSRRAVERRAWGLSRRHPHRSPEDNWLQAEQEMLQELFIAAR